MLAKTPITFNPTECKGLVGKYNIKGLIIIWWWVEKMVKVNCVVQFPFRMNCSLYMIVFRLKIPVHFTTLLKGSVQS